MELPSNDTPIVAPPGFWEELKQAQHRLLLFDYDGTLAPYNVARMEAQPVPGVLDIIRSIVDSQATRVAVISGRPAGELITLVGTLGVRLIGGHGFEVQDEEGQFWFQPLSKEQLASLQKAYDLSLMKGHHKLLERKHASVAVHTRGLVAEEARRIEEEVGGLWRSQIGEHEMTLRKFKGGIEFRTLGRDKGTAVQEIIAKLPAHTLIVYFGDDDSDEDAFRILPANAYSFKVGDIEQPTAARGRILDCQAVKQFLHQWYEHTLPGGRVG